MILAVKRLKTIGWIALIFIVAIALYPLSLSVATLRSDLGRVDRDILRTRSEIRYLETEFATRASLTQLAMWNDLEYGYEAPSAAQYLDGERELANLGDATRQLDKPVRVAAMTIKPQPQTPEISPADGAAGVTRKAEPLSAPAKNVPPSVPAAQAIAPVRASGAVIGQAAGQAPIKTATKTPNKIATTGATKGASMSESRRLLDDRLLDRINRQADAELKKTGGQ